MEIWKQSNICPDLEVSSLGNVRLLQSRKNGRYPQSVGRHKAGFVFKPNLKNGYETIRVSKNGKRKQYFVHRLVCDAFHKKTNIYQYGK